MRCGVKRRHLLRHYPNLARTATGVCAFAAIPFVEGSILLVQVEGLDGHHSRLLLRVIIDMAGDGHVLAPVDELRILTHVSEEELRVQEAHVVHGAHGDRWRGFPPVGEAEDFLVVCRLVPNVFFRDAPREHPHKPQRLICGRKVEEARIPRDKTERLQRPRNRVWDLCGQGVAIRGWVIPAICHALHIGVSVQCYKWVLCEDYVNVGEEHRDSNVEHLCENLEFERRGGVVVCPPTASLE
mmetsp:Transcript_8490/g.25360  ORF Transcript_8490/g.25360 Transcript_8490/m.25360 type:complete len:241 (-) Transcript_8490:952-1674(-)